MSKKTQYYIREKAKPSNMITADWQNASELVAHGHWEWAKPDGSKSSGQREFVVAQKEAQTGRPPEGFYDASPAVATGEVDYDEDEVVDTPAPVVEAVKEVAPVSAPAVPTAPVPMDLEDMTIDELREYAESAAVGLKVDRRVGTKSLIAQIKAVTEK